MDNSTASEILTEKHNDNLTIYKGKQICQQTQTSQAENQKY